MISVVGATFELYVGMTRAREMLIMLYTDEINYIPALQNTESQYDSWSERLKNLIAKDKKIVIR